MLHRRPFQLRGQFSLDSTEAKWARSMRDSGLNRDEIIAAFKSQMKMTTESSAVVADYYLENIDSVEILKHLLPKEPQSIEFKEKVADGYWLKAHGPEAEFEIILKIPLMSESDVHTLVNNYQKDLCWLAYKNSHEYSYNPHQLESGLIATPILRADIKPLLS